MTPPPIPVHRVSGTHREVGEQVGALAAETVRRAAEMAAASGRLDEAAAYREVTAAEVPWLVDELDGVADGAGADRLAVFAASIEELWGGDDAAPSQVAARAASGRCSDLVAAPPATADGHVWVAHANDLDESSEDALIALEWDVPGEPIVFTVGIGPWISVGFNSAGLSLTGNEVSPNDNRVGIPRLLGVRDALTRGSVDDATAALLHPRRASSYNDVLAHRDGAVVSVEASATDVELLRPASDGTLAHTNHYVGERMLRYEAQDPDDPGLEASATRLACAREWLGAAAPGSVTPALLRRALSDHSNAPASICRHAGDGSHTKTVFWCLADVTDGVITFGRGNPCDSQEQMYAFK
jgi:isopenicillin-N N-acyltransferase-like protein